MGEGGKGVDLVEGNEGKKGSWVWGNWEEICGG